MIRALIVERANRPGRFLVEDVLRWTTVAGSPAAGGVAAALAAEGIIVKAGTTRATRTARRSATVCEWIGGQFVEGQLELTGGGAGHRGRRADVT